MEKYCLNILFKYTKWNINFQIILRDLTYDILRNAASKNCKYETGNCIIIKLKNKNI